MKENELRLNNLVMVNYKTDLLSKVTWIQEGSINVVFDRQPDLVNGVVYSVNDLIPIELDEKIMLKIKGFEQVYNSKYTKIIEMYNPDKMQLIRWTLKKEQKKYTIEINGHDYPHILHLHQFQNIFFILFSEELVFSTEP